MWTNPPNVYEVTIPSNHSTIKTRAIVCIIGSYLDWYYCGDYSTKNLVTIAHTRAMTDSTS
jgi:hypothetical protein